ncbi:MAG TPA: hypothetical protein ENK23_01795, partial [Sorangium sp.]|nr:hypothetical protein [Sorangium sp.]
MPTLHRCRAILCPPRGVRSSLMLAALLLAGMACGDSHPRDTADAAPSASAATVEQDHYRSAMDLVEVLPTCDIDHRGLVLDMGTDGLFGRYGRWLVTPKGIVDATHDGASWSRVYERSLKLRFVLPHPARVFVSLRAIGRDSRRATVIIDNFVLSHLSLKKGAARTVTTRVSGLALDAGEHMVKIRFRGYRHNDSEPFAEIDWIRIGVPDSIERTYNPPTMDDLIAPAAQLGGVPHRALGLRGPSLVRCTLQVPPHGRFRSSVGFAGTGSGLAEFVARDAAGDTHVL